MSPDFRMPPPHPELLRSLHGRPVAVGMRRWLQAEGSLTRHLTRASGRVRVFFFNHTATTDIYTLSLPDALPT